MTASPLIGIVVCGGKSLRMGRDKSLLVYHQLPQRYHLYKQLLPHCDRVFLSCNKEQAEHIEEFYPFIVDKPKYAQIGPIAALLSANSLFPDATFVLIGCDYPYFNEKDLRQLLKSSESDAEIVCFYNTQTKIEQPLLALYKPACIPKLKEMAKQGNYSLRQLIQESKPFLLIPKQIKSLESVDTPEEFELAKQKLSKL